MLIAVYDDEDYRYETSILRNSGFHKTVDAYWSEIWERVDCIGVTHSVTIDRVYLK